MTERIFALKARLYKEPRFVSMEQALIITESYKRHEGEPRIIQRALALKAALETIGIHMYPGELIVGNRSPGIRSGIVFPESGCSWVDRELETLPRRNQDPFQVKEGDGELFRAAVKPYWEGKSLEDVLRLRAGPAIDEIAPAVKINQKDHAQGHICPGCALWLAEGPAGLQAAAEARAEAAVAGEAENFYRGVSLAMAGVRRFMVRYAELAETMAADPAAADASGAGQSRDLEETARICRNLARRPPETFREAVQSLWFLFVILHMESNASSFSPGRMDRYLYPFYERDTAAGRLDKNGALEIIECLWIKFNEIVYMRNRNSAKYFAGFPIGFNIAAGGQDEAGNDTANDLSFLFLKAQEDLGLPQPNLSVRLHRDTGDELLHRAIGVVARGSGMPQFFNDEAVIPALRHLGIEAADAADYAVVGCVELSTQGNNLGWSDAAMFNLNKVLELTLTGGRDLLSGRQIAPDRGNLAAYASFEELEAAFAAHLDWYIEKMIRCCEEVEKAHADLLPTPFLSAVIQDCLEKGVDVTGGGAKYNLSGIQMIQVANLADSLAAIKLLVYDERRVKAGEYLAALETDYEGRESLRQMILKRVPKYGNDVEWVDALGAKWAGYFRRALERYVNYRGGPYHTGMYTVSAHVPMGEMVGASPDGRRARSPLADGGMSPMYGRDITGPTAVLKSVSRMDKLLTSNGGLLNMKFLPEFFTAPGGVEKFGIFLRSFVDLEIPHIQFNVVRREDLEAARKNPEQYRSLTVRVAGYTAYFTELAGELQEEIIARTSYGSL
ncbi:MAG: formate C-acetyltransferase/glycerol dehydratase family glycyl radical enzyme [Spirochaetaceae bacterium]|jgi:formate C-acetyltransferase|nr:formate C-acetyltransferase/glycerol dehydratase family glycyl radical enzyme [Spirochaetaceae bacterium]